MLTLSNHAAEKIPLKYITGRLYSCLFVLGKSVTPCYSVIVYLRTETYSFITCNSCMVRIRI